MKHLIGEVARINANNKRFKEWGNIVEIIPEPVYNEIWLWVIIKTRKYTIAAYINKILFQNEKIHFEKPTGEK